MAETEKTLESLINGLIDGSITELPKALVVKTPGVEFNSIMAGQEIFMIKEGMIVPVHEGVVAKTPVVNVVDGKGFITVDEFKDPIQSLYRPSVIEQPADQDANVFLLSLFRQYVYGRFAVHSVVAIDTILEGNASDDEGGEPDPEGFTVKATPSVNGVVLDMTAK